MLVNIYDVQSALSRNRFVVYFSLVSRFVAAGLFWSFGPLWSVLVGLEVATGVFLGGAVVWEGVW